MTLTGAARTAYQREWIKQRRDDWILANGPCALCGSWDKLEVDHKGAKTKLIPVAQLWSLSEKNPKRVVELAKCWVLCFSCHQTKTNVNKEKARGIKSGTSKLNDSQVKEIRTLFATGKYSKRSIARQFDVDEKNIRVILKGETWRHVS